MSWSNEETFNFIKLYQSEPTIWDPNNPLYKDKNKVNDAWDRIVYAIQIPVPELKKKKESLMAAFRLNRKKKLDSIRSGMRGDEIHKPVWVFYDAMEAFLEGVYECKTNISTEGETNSLLREQKTANTGELRKQEIGISNGAKSNSETNDKKVTIRVVGRHDVKPPEILNGIKPLDPHAVNTFNQIMLKKEQKTEDECDLYGRLFANKLRKFSEFERQEIMYEVDGILLRRLQNHSHDSEDSKSMVFENESLAEIKLMEDSNEATDNEDSNEDRSIIHDVDVTTSIETELDEPDTHQEENDPLDPDVLINVRSRIKSTNLRCETCNKSFSDRRSFTVHNRQHDKSKCDICDRVIRVDNMRKHVLMMHTAEPSVCPICGATFKNSEGVRCHIFHYHKHTAQRYVCDECGKTFRKKYNFSLHKKKVHMCLKSFKCSTCGKAFFTKASLSAHVRMTHEKQRPHVCEYCGTGFSSKHVLKTHKRQHTNEKPFVCEHCSEGFRQRVSLRSHLKSKHGIEEVKEFFCETCEKGFATNWALNIHQRLHETKKCEICSENFAGDEYLANHLIEVHQVEVEIKQDS
ncbi:zinc finger protein 391 [Diabrotica virgifera virgifera]|uniref:Zinc finger protein 391-like n=1 Tax=Diabrotica virgifera virgifera TaxID=50390 RepID=A0A6P7G9L5_DIAVI|nr:zinc finger protein 391 [Diabrotica virgifera virgifera]